jgi:hypothetical protein
LHIISASTENRDDLCSTEMKTEMKTEMISRDDLWMRSGTSLLSAEMR